MSDVHDDTPAPLRSIADAIDSMSPDPVEGLESSQPSQGEIPPNFDDSTPQPLSGEDAIALTLAKCCELDQSDTDNGHRLIAYFGNDIVVMQAAGIAGGDFLTWTGTHWDMDGGAAGAAMLAQRVGDFIQLETDFMEATPFELKLMERGKAAEAEYITLSGVDPEKMSDEQKARLIECRAEVAAGKSARAALSSRKTARRKFGVSSKNKSRVDAMLSSAAPHLRKPIDQFNADPFLVATQSHTLRFIKTEERDDECPDPDVVRMKVSARVEADPAHRREDLITALVPAIYNQGCIPLKWLAFLERMLPDENVRRTVRQFAGLGLLGLPVQKFMFHYGEGANGKSVFLETLVRLLGKSFAVGLPTESIIGVGDRNAGGASPDLFRLFGKRMVRILELPEGKPLQSELIKKLTGGEEIPVRTLFKGFIDFQPRAKPHMSGNGLPKITDTSNGIWRRMLFVKWPVTLALAEQRDLEEVVTELLTERSGMLNWLIDGALDYLEHGLYIAPSVEADTAEYRKEMDIVMQFYQDCIESVPGETVPAREMYLAFKAWCEANAKSPLFETKFGRDMKRYCKRDDGRVRKYLDVKLSDDRPKPVTHHLDPPPVDSEGEYVPL